MKIYAIGDLHLSTNSEKPMDIFGAGWENHFKKIKNDWERKVTDEDIVLIPGDISWAMKLEDALADLELLAPLKGKKVFIRGNHDYWWNGISKIRAAAPTEQFFFLQTDAIRIENFVFVGSRGWTCPGSPDFTERDEKLYKREAERFRLALIEGEKLKKEGDTLIALVHYPPFNLKREESAFTMLFKEYGVDKAVFGHLHGSAFFPMCTQKDGIEYLLTSCDKTGFQLVEVHPRGNLENFRGNPRSNPLQAGKNMV
ncbi:MAG: metallophosphoesterase [Clostridia bacterium]|nr:metallophosphoesterase [Clostridia bacterium]